MPIDASATPTRAALAVLITLQTVMLWALFARTPPHPPAEIVLFGMAPFLAVAISAALAALLLTDERCRAGSALALLAALLALVSFGPQKWVDPSIAKIWPAVLAAEIAVAVIAIRLGTALRRGGRSERP
ncbi:hypothetical protein GN330_08455 [Nitratireductor sp. CAU 1489]|uniref:Uncharacterized protein n=1 Tax=Nitratireductor arenosus TaxID=2682096 RepID=A0A844QE46_9HYPH|nr:hypothetical protein [Nitratireductor arenosus]MVA97277.1 hypothetical protein [Nitratireductor arenosus]